MAMRCIGQVNFRRSLTNNATYSNIPDVATRRCSSEANLVWGNPTNDNAVDSRNLCIELEYSMLHLLVFIISTCTAMPMMGGMYAGMGMGMGMGMYPMYPIGGGGEPYMGGGGAGGPWSAAASVVNSILGGSLKAAQINADLLDRQKTRDFIGEQTTSNQGFSRQQSIDERLHDEWRLNATLENRNFLTGVANDIQREYLVDGKEARREHHAHTLDRLKVCSYFSKKVLCT